MTEQLYEETNRACCEAQIALAARDPKAAAELLLAAWGTAMRLAYPPRGPERLVERLLAGEGA